MVIAGTGASTDVSASTRDEAAIRYSALAMETTLAERCGVPDKQITVLTDPTADDAIEALAEAVRRAGERDGTLLVYYVGHGLRDDARGRLYLATAGATLQVPQEKGLAFQRVSEILETGPPGTVLFLDCCFSGRLRKDLYRLRYEPFSSSLPNGRFVLTAVGDERAYVALDGKITVFTRELVKLLTLGDPRFGRNITAKDCYRHLASVLPDLGFPEPLHFSSGSAENIVLVENRSRAPDTPEEVEPPDETVEFCPYLGLRSFGPSEAAYFFGRDDLTRALVDKVRTAPGIVAVIGNSGAGESSLVHAGLFPSLEHQQEVWRHRSFQPGARPLQALAATVRAGPADLAEQLRGDPDAARVLLERDLDEQEPRDARLLLIVDQCEELFSLCEDADEIEAFTICLEALARSRRIDVWW